MAQTSNLEPNLHLIMKTNEGSQDRALDYPPQTTPGPAPVQIAAWLATALVLLVLASPAVAALHAPDNVIYGTVALGSKQATSTDTAVTVEARGNGLLLARYRMGDNANAGNHYMLSVRLEEQAPRGDPISLLPGETLTISVLSNGVPQMQQGFTVAERGEIRRIDFGTVPTNVHSGFALWADQLGLGTDSQTQDADSDGSSNLAEYTSGTNPKDHNDKFVLRIAESQNGPRISFEALRTDGAGYQGLARHYALQRVANVRSSDWQTVPGYADVVGANQEVVYQPSTSSGPFFYRGVVWLAQVAAADQFELHLTQNAGQAIISFAALGPNGQGQNRYYTLEQSSNLVAGSWLAISGQSNVLGAGQTITYTIPNRESGNKFYRGRVDLRSP